MNGDRHLTLKKKSLLKMIRSDNFLNNVFQELTSAGYSVSKALGLVVNSYILEEDESEDNYCNECKHFTFITKEIGKCNFDGLLKNYYESCDDDPGFERAD